ncbi:MAG: peptidoglycan-binding protein [bacterium]|nr:peptidoglycan-binding protein [bacterium]
MKKKSLIYSLIAVLIGMSFASASTPAYAATPNDLVTKYRLANVTGTKVNVLIVPGHDDEYSGTEFGDIRESDVVVAIGQYLYDYLKADTRLNVRISRTQAGYTPAFKNYFENNREEILQFISTSRAAYKNKISSGQIKSVESVPHNAAPDEVAIRLYGINKWANENNVDIILHLHVNDAGGRVWGQPGEYTGVSVYIPEGQFVHAPTSAVLGESMYSELILKNKKSNYPPEANGLLEDQDLIAVGANGTLTNAAIALIEYGYIYEPQFTNLAIQETITQDFAHQTFLGLHRFFRDRELYARSTPAAPRPTVASAVPTFKTDLELTMQNADVSALQNVLTKEGVYSCEITGYYGPCTQSGVKALQKKYGIRQTGVVGPLTRAKLNSLFSR